VAPGVVGLAGLAFGAINAAAPPLFLASIPQHLIGRVMSVFTPLRQLAGIASPAVAGWLAGTGLRGMHAVVAGVTFGPIDTIFGLSALLIMAARHRADQAARAVRRRAASRIRAACGPRLAGRAEPSPAEARAG
jgi:MFS family permease